MGDGTLRMLPPPKERNGTVEQGVVERSTDPNVSERRVCQHKKAKKDAFLAYIHGHYMRGANSGDERS